VLPASALALPEERDSSAASDPGGDVRCRARPHGARAPTYAPSPRPRRSPAHLADIRVGRRRALRCRSGAGAPADACTARPPPSERARARRNAALQPKGAGGDVRLPARVDNADDAGRTW
jgi:hypothetical protein